MYNIHGWKDAAYLKMSDFPSHLIDNFSLESK